MNHGYEESGLNSLKACAAISVGLLAGCTSSSFSSNPDAPDNEVAIIHGASSASVLVSPTPVIVRSVDGRSVSGASSSVRLSPGRHLLRVTCYQSLFSKNTHDLDVTVAAGRSYELVSDVSPDKISDGTPDCEARIRDRGRE